MYKIKVAYFFLMEYKYINTYSEVKIRKRNYMLGWQWLSSFGLSGITITSLYSVYSILLRICIVYKFS